MGDLGIISLFGGGKKTAKIDPKKKKERLVLLGHYII